MEFRILGPLEVGLDGPPFAARGRKPRALLALLVLHRNETVPADRLIDDLWGESPPATAANTLQVYVAQLRKLVEDRLVREGTGYRLRVEPSELDAERFERMAGEGASALASRSYAKASEQLLEALGIWRGPALVDVQYEPFARAEITRLEELRLVAIEDRLEAELGLGRDHEVVPELEALVSEYPVRERLRGLLMLALYRGGRQADALDTYREARRVLVDELGLEPGPELRELEQAILRQDESLARRTRPESNVPAPVSSLVGRERELEEICTALRSEDVRLLTLTGPGGAGKTRLALEAVNALADELPDVLKAVPGLTLLVTSRAALRLSGEQEYPVQPLGRSDAVALFVERSRGADPAFRLTDENSAAVEEICARLDDLPLALELAAARTKVLPPEAMLQRLDQRLDLLSRGPRDLPERHRALRDTIAWSYELLEPEEQQVFARLAAFAGGCTLESAETVCDAALDSLSVLVDDSLLERAGERLRMLETIREYAAERLELEGDAEIVRRRHAEHFLELVESDAPPNKTGWVARLDDERDNLRAALSWSLEAEEAELALRLAAALWEYWWVRGHLAEGSRRLAEALEQGAAQSPQLRASALHAAARLATRQGDYERAAELSEQSLALWEELGDAAGTAQSLLSLGTVAAEQGERERAIELSERAAELYRESGDRRGHALAVSNLGGIALDQGDYARAAALSEQAYGLFEAFDDSEGMAFALVNQGFAALSEHDHKRALGLLREALRRLAELEFRDVIGYCFEGLAAVLAFTGEAGPAARLLGAAEALRESVGVDLAPTERATHETTAAAVREALGEKRFSAAWRLGRDLPLDEAITYALAEEPARA